MKALDRKLLRELVRMRGQMLSIALVVAAGVMTVVTLRGTYESLAASLERFYRDYRFADVFVQLERAPEQVAARVAELPGVAAVQSRVRQVVTLEVRGLDDLAVGLVLSVPSRPHATLNDVHIVRGRYIDPMRGNEVLISESFAVANALEPGETITAVINGRRRTLEIVGIAISPDYIGEIAPGTIFPDDRRFGIIRMNRDALAAAAAMEGAFNELSLSLSTGASEQGVIAALDRLLEPYGGLGAHGRAMQQSHEAVTGELEQNRVTGTIIPAIFLGVAAFLLSIVLGRLVGTQRDQIAVLKAFGYTNLDVGRHYFRFAMAASLAGALLGTTVGIWMGGALTELYGQFFRFPDLAYEVRWGLVAFAALISVGAAALGALGAVRRAVRLPPAEAMRPEMPARYRPGPLERAGLGRLLPASGRMIVRNVERQPLRTVMAATGVALSVAILVVSVFFFDAVEHMIAVQFVEIQREDLAVGFTAPRGPRAALELASLPGVTAVELHRVVPVRFASGHTERSTVLNGVVANASLRRVIDRRHGPVTMPSHGVVLNSKLASILGVAAGDTVTMRVLEGRRVERDLPVAGTVEELFGIAAYMDFDALHDVLREAPAASGAYLRVDADRMDTVNAALRDRPLVMSVYAPGNLRESFEQQLGENLLVSITFLVVLAGILAVGVIYNGARIALSERGRELASLRVLGFTRREVSVLLLGEQASVTALAIPLGWLIGLGFGVLILGVFDMERFRIPLVISARTYLFSAFIAVASAALAGWLVRRRLNRLNMIEVLKTRE